VLLNVSVVCENKQQLALLVCHSSHMPVGELIAYFDASAALVHTPQLESFGLVAAEALARNLKLFGFNTGGLRDVAQGAAGAVLVTPGDWPALEREISAWLSQGCPPTRPNRDLMAARYHVSIIAGRHLEIHSEVLSTCV
jgi:glycosyltransferase involved in cell wall biosynthesis